MLRLDCGAMRQGNNFTYSCIPQVAYINDICLTSAAPAPAPGRVPPLGVPTTGSRTASGGLPRTNITLPALNSSSPGVVYPGQPPCPHLPACTFAIFRTCSSCCWSAAGLRPAPDSTPYASHAHAAMPCSVRADKGPLLMKS